MKTYLILFLFFLSVFILTAGGRIASSDETAFFLETQSLVEHGTLAITDSIVNNGAYGKDGRFYVGGGVGFIPVSAPFYLLGKMLVSVLPIPDLYHTLVLKASFSLINQIIGGLIGLIFFVWCRQFDYSKRVSFFLTSGLLFTTNIFPYAKSSMREPLLVLCLIALSYFLIAYRKSLSHKHLHAAGFFMFYLILTKFTFLVIVPGICLYLFLIRFREDEKVNFVGAKEVISLKGFQSGIFILFFWLCLAAAISFIYNYSLYGSMFESGYSRVKQPFSTPLLVGLYGLLFSSGKSFFLYAPLTLLGIWSFRLFYAGHKEETIFFCTVFFCMLILHAKFFTWGADGSWGPRYLIPVLPFFLIPIGVLFKRDRNSSGKNYKSVFVLLFLVGFVIQLGGLSVYFGSYLRYIGEFPYTREQADPEFLYRSHFVPNFSPVTGHWGLLSESIRKHVDGEMTGIKIASDSDRIPLSESDRKLAVYFIDYWFMYAYYAGLRGLWIAVALFINFAMLAYFGYGVYKIFYKTNEIVL